MSAKGGAGSSSIERAFPKHDVGSRGDLSPKKTSGREKRKNSKGLRGTC